MFEDLLRNWDGEEVAARYDAPTETWMFVCVHSTRLGPAAGGTRMNVYPMPVDALRDGLLLGGAMTRKNAVAGLPLGGGKAVLAVPEIPVGERRRELFLRYADLVTALGGTYRTAADMNTSPADMDVLAERSPYVFGRSVEAGGSGSSAPGTAVGVFHGIRASLRHVFGSPELEGRTALVQGVGAVGRHLVQHLRDAGARVIVADVEPSRAEEAAAATGAEVVAPKVATSTECDVLSPCATGGVLSATMIPKLCCRIVAGAANNQLATPEDGDRLAEAGIVYAPDYVVNAGGIIHLASLELLGEDRAKLGERLRGIGDTLAEVFAMAERESMSTSTAAERLAEARLAAA